MSKSTYFSFIAIAFAAVVCGGLSPMALARQDNDLQQENLALKRKVADLEQQLAAANNTIRELRQRIDQLNRALRQASAGTDDADAEMPVSEVTIDESKPEASPRALFGALQSDYETSMVDEDMGDPGDRQRTAYLRAVDRWVAAANRKYRSKIEWHIKPFQPPTGARPTTLNFVAVDPVTHAELGKPFAVPLSRSHQRRLESLEHQGKLDVVVLKGVLIPRLVFDPDAEAPGTFDRPRLVGPFAVFDFAIEPSSFSAVEGEEESDAG